MKRTPKEICIQYCKESRCPVQNSIDNHRNQGGSEKPSTKKHPLRTWRKDHASKTTLLIATDKMVILYLYFNSPESKVGKYYGL